MHVACVYALLRAPSKGFFVFPNTPYATMEENNKSIISIEEYRAILDDSVSTPEEIRERIGYIEALCRGVIRGELENYGKTQ